MVLLPSGKAAAVDLMHNSTDTGSGTTKWPNGWGIAGGKYGQFICATCHEPDASNLKNIRGTINSMNSDKWPNGATAINVVFQNQTGMGNDAVRRTSSNRICEVCHSQNRFHNFSTTSNLSHGGALGHPTPSSPCMNCHKHNTGFKAACGGCHGNPPTSTVLGGYSGLVGTPRASNAMQSGQAGAHAKHVNPPHNMICDTCHDVTNGGITMPNESGTIQIGFFGFAGTVTTGTYTPYTSATRGYRFVTGKPGTVIAPGQTLYANANKCSNVYCHGGGAPGKAALIGGTNTTPRWDLAGQGACGNCHGTSPATPPGFGNHFIHASNTKYNVSCDTCHPNNANNTHVQGYVSWVMKTTDPRVGASATYNGAASGTTPGLAPSASYSQCANIVCHTNGKGQPGIVAAPTWGQTLGCAGCHGGAVGQTTLLTTGKHAAHTNNAGILGTNYGCVVCHAKTVSNDTTISSFPTHLNQLVDYSGSKAGKQASYNSSNGVCSATICHADGKGTLKIMVAGTGWNSPTTLVCDGCHGSDLAPFFPSVAGEPNYANQGVNQTRANNHQKHVGSAGAITCAYCHGTTVNTSGAIINNSTTHINRRIDVIQGGLKTFTYVGGSKTCSSISCHGTGSPSVQWGYIMNVDCSGCHGGNLGANTIISTGKHTAHVNNLGVLGDNIGCIECHAKTVTADRTLAAGTNHINGLADYSGAKAGKSSTYTTSNGVCTASYCHTDGKGTPLIMTTDTWKAATTLNCSGCHGADGTPAFTSVAGEPNYATAGGGVLRSNSHQTHTTTIVGYIGAASCDICHTNTVVTAGTTIKAGSSHLNKSIDVNFNVLRATANWNALTKTCSNISCHNNQSSTWGDINSAGCFVCHGNLTASHGVHINDLLSSGMVTIYNYTGIHNSGTVYRIGCANCHPTDPAKHRNGTVEVTINKSKLGGVSYVSTLNSLATADGIGVANSGVTGTAGLHVYCAASYCHSNGRTIPLTALDFKDSPDWYQITPPTANRCGMCHDNPPQYAGQSHYVTSSTLGNNNSGGPYKDSGHMVGIHFKNTAKGNNQNGFLGYSNTGNMAHGNTALATTISCYICHSGIVSTSTIDTYAMTGSASKFRCATCHTGSTRTKLQNGLIVNTALHMNGVKDVVFYPGTIKTKAQLATAANALGWIRSGSGIYKDVAAYDIANLAVSTWDSGTKTCLTACHVNQPGITWGGALQCVSCHAHQ
jgi:predicted CxxxxCH...CXXCH cytochrome family protein